MVWAYWGPIAAYLADQHYQEHFVYLWVFLALALTRTLRGPFRSGWAFGSHRDLAAVCIASTAGLVLWASAAAGSTTGQRLSLVALLTALALAIVPRWSTRRCLAHGLLLALCFGVPYAVWFPVTTHLQWGVASVIALPAKLGIASYEVVGPVVRFPHYLLTITANCSGIGQLLTFSGIAALGLLGGISPPWRVLLVCAAAVGLAWLSNVVRVGMFVALVGCGWTQAVDSDALHAALGFASFLPFVATLVWVILRTHRPLPREAMVRPEGGRHHVGWLLAPVMLARLVAGHHDSELPRPDHFDALERPVSYRLIERGPSEESDRVAYDTPWLVNARFADEAGRMFDLLHYVTASRTHLCVHKVANCLQRPGATATYRDAIEVDGLRWWRLELAGGAAPLHVYFAFEVAGERRDDSPATALAVFANRLAGGGGVVRLWRVVFPGAMPATPDEHARGVLTWLGRSSRAAATRPVPSGR